MAEQATREQFEAAARKVMETAPSGLSREQFFALVDKELSGGGAAGGPVTAPSRSAPASDPTLALDYETRKEPDTWWGGFKKGLKDYYSKPANVLPEGTIDLMQRAAHPTTTGDILGLLIPTGTGNAVKQISGVGRVLKEAAGRSPKIWNVPGKALEVAGELDRANDMLKMGVESPLSRGMASSSGNIDRGIAAAEELPTSSVDRYMANQPAAVSRGTTRFDRAGDIASEVDRYMPNTGGAAAEAPSAVERVPYGGPSEAVVPPGPPPRLAGKAPTLDEVLEDALQEARGPQSERPAARLDAYDDVVESTTAPKSDKLAKFQESSEDPYDAILTERYGEELPHKLINPGGVGDLPADFDLGGLSSGPSGGRGSGTAAPDIPSQAAEMSTASGLPETLDTLMELDPGGMAGRAQELRRLKGARDAAVEMFGRGGKAEQGAIRTMAPGPSQVPLEAADRIERARRAAGGKDVLGAMLMAGLGGHTARNLWE